MKPKFLFILILLISIIPSLQDFSIYYFPPNLSSSKSSVANAINSHYVNPYLYYTSPPAPSGIASFGIYNYSGNIVTYVIKTNGMYGYANITSLLAYYKNALRYGVNPYTASLQFNIVLFINSSSGIFAYWLQDVGVFQTNKNYLTFVNNIWNLTGRISTLNPNSVIGNGKVSSAGGGQSFYYDVGPSYSYSFPLALVFVVNVSYSSSAVYIWFGYKILQIGNTRYNTLYYYDKVTIYHSGINSAYIMINGNIYTPDGLYYDAELVWGGGGNGAPTSFIYLNCTLGLYYNQGGKITPVPSLYTFGSNTAETAYNVHVTTYNGIPKAYKGIEILTILTNNFSKILF